MMVRNVPFQSDRADLLRLFGAFIKLRRVRIPKKFDGSHRGFAFVEYVTGQDAREAMDSLKGTHLYGRRLVLEWADEDDEGEGEGGEDGGGEITPPKNKRIRFT